jgi:hypothetical protein
MKKSPIQNIHNEPVNQLVNNETAVDDDKPLAVSSPPQLSYRDLQRKMLIAIYNQLNSCDVELLMDAAFNIWLDCPYLHEPHNNKGNDI